MNYLGDLRVEATRENLRTISFFINGIAQQLDLTGDALFDVELAVEEAATNIISHAYGIQNKGIIALHAELDDDRLRITLKDWGKPFDPRTVTPFDINAPVETRIKGGMGLHFIHSLMDGVERHMSTQPDEPNTLTLIKSVKKSPARYHRKREWRELNVMQTVSEVMTTGIEVDELLEIIVNKLVETIEAERGTLYLIDEERGECWSKVLLEDADVLPEIRVKIGEGIAGKVAETGEVLNITDAHSHPLFNPKFDAITGFHTETILTVPMRNPQQRIIGVVQLLNKSDGAFTQQDARLLLAMASQAAILIENARLYQQELEQKIIERELETAKTIQERFLPEGAPEVDGWDIAAFWRPVHNIAGDFYDVFPLKDGRLAVIIADVSGKGIPAALLMALTVTILRFGMSLGLGARDMLNHTNDGMLNFQRSRFFATIFVGYLDLQSGEMQFASAGHNPPIWYHAASRTCDYVEVSGVAAGVFSSATFDEKALSLESDDILVLYTDGITEIMTADEDEFGEERLEQLIIDHADASADTLCQIIIDAIHAFAGDAESFDDETLLVIKRAPKPV